jgi:uncharacterized membrane protein
MNSSISKTRLRIRRITIVGILSAISIGLNYTPFAFMLVPGLQVQITLMHIPVIIGAILEGPMVGAFVGLMFGLFSLYTATITPLPIAFAFINPLVSVLPRVLIGIGAYYVYSLFTCIFKQKKRALSVGAGAAAGALINTVGVLGMIYLLYAQRFLDALGIGDVPAAVAIFGLALPNAPLELAAALLITIPVVAAVKRARKQI